LIAVTVLSPLELTNCDGSRQADGRGTLGGFNVAGTLTSESGQKATVLSGDSNLNGDVAADRTILNPAASRAPRERHGAYK
jgi:hypothetical protein